MELNRTCLFALQNDVYSQARNEPNRLGKIPTIESQGEALLNSVFLMDD